MEEGHENEGYQELMLERKTKVMRCQVGKGQVGDSGEYLCRVCRNGVGHGK